ncbi:hypothetical protein [Salinarimonas soli]|uniref:Uncharacterized protein n=1 Tax=Salinarimonas soli TaxID=1638099 RepID=A0A5B2VDU6_9HYPH|nr:hypothetical protein [Salinarimonas soli]KAA2236898.1 hypothetical protein F0L46_12980 [Salinarimonas soli]
MTHPALTTAADQPGAAIIAAADLIGRIERLSQEIEAFKLERTAEPVRNARARLGIAYHNKRSGLPDGDAQAA